MLGFSVYYAATLLFISAVQFQFDLETSFRFLMLFRVIMLMSNSKTSRIEAKLNLHVYSFVKM